jgi:hypothetical protein
MTTLEKWDDDRRREFHKTLLDLSLDGKSMTAASLLGLANPNTVVRVWKHGYPKLSLAPIDEATLIEKQRRALHESEHRIAVLEKERELIEKEKEIALDNARRRSSIAAQAAAAELEEREQINKALRTTLRANSLAGASAANSLARETMAYAEELANTIREHLTFLKQNRMTIPFAELRAGVQLLRDIMRLLKDTQQVAQMMAETELLLESSNPGSRVSPTNQLDLAHQQLAVDLAQRNLERQKRRAGLTGPSTTTTVVVMQQTNSSVDQTQGGGVILEADQAGDQSDGYVEEGES